jgi:hypothetical protein
MRRLWAAVLTAGIVLTACPLFAGETTELPRYWPEFEAPDKLYVTCDVDDLPSLAPGKDPGGNWGALAYTLQSLSGLAAAAVKDGRCDSMIWLNLVKNPSYQIWLEKILKSTEATRIDAPDALELISTFRDMGIINGYILYRADPSDRGLFIPADNHDDFDDSVNVATTLAGLLEGIIVEESIEPAIQKLGLRRLADVRGKDQKWCFENYRAQCSRRWVHIVDPKAPHLRAMAVASRSLCIYGVTPFTEEVLRWLEPNAPVIGWNAGDEYHMTSQFSRVGHYHTASNWCMNLPVTGVVEAGEHVPWKELDINRNCSTDPLELEWGRDTHYTAFVNSDGDNVQWYMGDFLTSKNFWASPDRTTFPMGWTAPVTNLSQIAVPALSYMADTMSHNDQVVSFAAGYFYPDEYAVAMEDPISVLNGRIDQFADTFERLGIKVLVLLSMDWDNSQAVAAYEQFAKKLPGLTGIMTIQYYPYNAGLGRIIWVENAEGAPIPVVSARYAIWNNFSSKENNGPPAFIASRINAMPWQGEPVNENYFDWTVMHAWSFFEKADTSEDLWAEDMPQDQAYNNPNALAGVSPVRWCVQELEPHVKVVLPEELMWRIRLHLKPGPTLAAIARGFIQENQLPGDRQTRLKEFIHEVKDLRADNPQQARSRFEELKQIRFGQ